MSDLENEHLDLDKSYEDEWDLGEEQMSSQEINDKRESVSQEIATLRERINSTQTTLDHMLQHELNERRL